MSKWRRVAPAEFSGSVALNSTLTYASGLGGIVEPLWTAAATPLTEAATLAVNTYYHNSDTNTAIFALPAAADSTAGDVIKVQYVVNLADGEIHDYGTSGEFFADTSVVYFAGAAANAQVWQKDNGNGSSDDYLKLTGADDAGHGIGTHLTFVFNGSTWHVEAWCYSQGAGSVASTAAFAAATG